MCIERTRCMHVLRSFRFVSDTTYDVSERNVTGATLRPNERSPSYKQTPFEMVSVHRGHLLCLLL